MSQHAAEFLDRFFQLFFRSFLTNIEVGVICALIGLFIVLRRMVFVSAALSQVAGAGLALAFLMTDFLAPAHTGQPAAPVRLDERMDEGEVDEETEDIADTLEEEFPDLEGPGGQADATPKKGPKEPPPPVAGSQDGGEGGEKNKGRAAAPSRSLDSQADERAGPRHEEGIQIPPAATAIFLTILVSLLLARRAGAVGAGGAKTSEETLVGLLFILGSALTLIFAVKADKAAHEIQDVLFGVAVMVPREQQSLVMVVGVAFIAVYLLMFKDFLFVSFDPVVATVAGFPVGWANSVLFILMAVVISVCTRAVGAMPVFALTVLPPTAALQIHDRIVPAAITSAVLGGAAAGLGYFATGIWELPVGPCIVLAAAIPALAAWSVRRVLSWHKVRGERKQTLG